jgi:hypothetical protein
MKTLVCAVLAFGLILPGAVQVMHGGKSSQKAAAPPSAQDIANAKSEGLVWVNLKSRVYHKSGDSYGKTKHGKFISEEEAKKEGFVAAKEPATSKKSKKPDQSGIDATIDTHATTPPKP